MLLSLILDNPHKGPPSTSTVKPANIKDPTLCLVLQTQHHLETRKRQQQVWLNLKAPRSLDTAQRVATRPSLGQGSQAPDTLNLELCTHHSSSTASTKAAGLSPASINFPASGAEQLAPSALQATRQVLSCSCTNASIPALQRRGGTYVQGTARVAGRPHMVTAEPGPAHVYPCTTAPALLIAVNAGARSDRQASGRGCSFHAPFGCGN